MKDIFDIAMKLADENPDLDAFNVVVGQRSYRVEVKRGEGLEMTGKVFLSIKF